MKQLMTFLLLIALTEEKFACQRGFAKQDMIRPFRPVPFMRIDPDFNPDGSSPFSQHSFQVHNIIFPQIVSATITCTNISSFSEISDQHLVRQEYEQYLNITSSNISIIPSSAFAEFYVITKLYLRHIHIKNILPEAFKNLTNLQELYLDDNELTDLEDGVFKHLDNLKILHLKNNKLRQIGSRVFADLGNLTNLQLENNQLSRIDDDFLKPMSHLRVLDLTGNPLKAVPQTLYSLEELDMAYVSISQFNVDWSKSNLKSLNLSSNYLSVMDFSLLPKACSLFLDHNKISILRNMNMFNANTLTLKDNEISTVTEAFRNVKKLNLAQNSIKALEGSFFNKSAVLQFLNLSSNKIAIIKYDTFLGLSSLEDLILANNDITKIEVGLFRDLKALNFLSLSHNKIEEFQFGTFDTLENLKELDIAYNNLVDLHEYTFHSLRQLVNLRLDNNRISSLEVSVFTQYLQRLRLVSLDKNPWNCRDLVRIERTLSSRGVLIEWGDTFDVENFHGVSCINRIEFEENVNGSDIIKILGNFKQQPMQIKYSNLLSLGMIIQIMISLSLLVIIFLIFVMLRDKLRSRHNTSELLSQIEF